MCVKKNTENAWRKACDGVYEVLVKMEYSKSILYKYSSFYKNLLSFLTQRKLIDKPVDKKHTDAFLRFYWDTSYRVETKQLYVCALRRLLEFHQKGSFERIARRTIPVLLPAPFESILVEYQQYRAAETFSTSERAQRRHLNDIRDFLHCLCERKKASLHRICFDDIQAFVKKYFPTAPSRVSHKTSAVRSFFRFLIATQKGVPALLRFIPRIHHARVFRLAAIWPQTEVKKLLSAIDRKTAVGKRDYSIILLVSKLGLRISDVRNLRIENIDWRKSLINIEQQKTKNFQELPMPEDVGNALIDYLINGRPSVSSRHVFVSHQAPYENFNSSLSRILAKYREKADIVLPETSRQGWHSLRHSLATRLLEENTPLPVIATILGHASVNTTRIYARTNVEMLRSAALEWEES